MAYGDMPAHSPKAPRRAACLMLLHVHPTPRHAPERCLTRLPASLQVGEPQWIGTCTRAHTPFSNSNQQCTSVAVPCVPTLLHYHEFILIKWQHLPEAEDLQLTSSDVPRNLHCTTSNVEEIVSNRCPRYVLGIRVVSSQVHIRF